MEFSERMSSLQHKTGNLIQCSGWSKNRRSYNYLQSSTICLSDCKLISFQKGTFCQQTQRSTILKFQCKESVNLGNTIIPLLSLIRYNSSVEVSGVVNTLATNCQLVLTIQSRYACALYSLYKLLISSEFDDRGGGLSAGSIMLISLACLVFVYVGNNFSSYMTAFTILVVVGLIVQNRRGRTGLEVKNSWIFVL